MNDRFIPSGSTPNKVTREIVEELCELMIVLTVLAAISCGCFALSDHLRQAESILASTQGAIHDIAF